MKAVVWTGVHGKKHRSMLRDDMPEYRPQDGYLSDPPDIFQLNWERLKIQLHNELVNRGLFTYQDVINSQNGLTAAVLAVFRKEVKNLYRQQEVK